MAVLESFGSGGSDSWSSTGWFRRRWSRGDLQGWLVVVQLGPNEPKTSVNNRSGNYTSSEAAFRFLLNTKPPRASERYTVKDSTIFTV